MHIQKMKFITFIKESNWKYGMACNIALSIYSSTLDDLTGFWFSLAPFTLLTIGLVNHYLQLQKLEKEAEARKKLKK